VQAAPGPPPSAGVTRENEGSNYDERAAHPRPSTAQRHLKCAPSTGSSSLDGAVRGRGWAGFSCTVFFDVVTRSTGPIPVLWVQEVTTNLLRHTASFSAPRLRCGANDHLNLSAVAESMTGLPRLAIETFNRLVMIGVGLCMVYFGLYQFPRRVSRLPACRR